MAALRTARDDDAAKIEAVTKRHQELQADWKELDKRSQQLKAEVTKQRDAAAAIEKEAITVEADKQRLEAAVAAATDKVNDSQGADKAKAQAELERANAELAEIHQKMEDVYQRKATIITRKKPRNWPMTALPSSNSPAKALTWRQVRTLNCSSPPSSRMQNWSTPKS